MEEHPPNDADRRGLSAPNVARDERKKSTTLLSADHVILLMNSCAKKAQFASVIVKLEQRCWDDDVRDNTSETETEL